jgi:hypothetical protein
MRQSALNVRPLLRQYRTIDFHEADVVRASLNA